MWFQFHACKTNIGLQVCIFFELNLRKRASFSGTINPLVEPVLKTTNFLYRSLKNVFSDDLQFFAKFIIS